MPRTEPASPAQEGMWFLHQLAPGSPFYNVPMAVAFETGWDPAAVTGAVQELVRRHEVLRVSYSSEAAGAPVQVIADELTIEIPHTDAGGRRADLERQAQATFEAPFDLARGPLLRAHAVTTGPGRGVLLLTLHHSTCDHWSLNLLARELRALARGESLPAPAHQYSDFARWQQASLGDGELAAQLEYWRARLARAPAVIDLPLDRPRSAGTSFAGGARRWSLGPELSRRLEELAHEQGASLFMVLLAAFDLLLHRSGRQSDVVVGTWTAGRNRTEYESVVGVFANTLLIRTDLTGNPRFEELIGRVRERVLEAMANQDVRIETLVRELAPPRTAAHMPLCQVVFSHQNFPEETLAARRGGRRRGAEVAVRRNSTKYDLVVYSMGEGSADGIELLVEYSSELFEDATIGRLLAQYERILEQVAAAPGLRAGEVEVLTRAERRRIVVDWNQTAAPFPRTATLDGLFHEQATRAPGAIALKAGPRTLTAGALDAAASRIAERLLAAGVETGDVVCVCGPRSPEIVAGMLGAMRAGAAYLPLDPAYPAERLAFMLEDSRARLVLAAGDPPLPEGTPALALDGCFDAGGSAPVLPRRRPDVAYVIYTSGSTGRPKGVLGRHRATVNRLAWQWRTYPFATDEVCVQKTAISFVDSVAEVFAPLLRGVPLVIVDDAEARDPFRLLMRLAEERVTRLVVVPSLLRVLLDAAPDLARALPDLRICVSSGEPLSGELAARFLAAHRGARLLNLYGSSEVAADATAQEVTRALPGRPVAIGRPIANTEVFVLDGYRQPVPWGAHGEIWVAGEGLAASYLNRPDLTAERFVQLHLEGRSVLAYRTGDLGRLRRDGVLEHAGRVDHQLKVRGARVEPGEIEVVLNSIEGVNGAVVAGRGPVDDVRLVAYLETSSGRAAVEAARQAVQRQLPPHEWPAAYVTIETFPLTPNGKVNRGALPPPPEHDATAGAHFEAPRDEREAAIAAVFAEVLGVSEVGVHDDFFELGGHSLTATQVVARLRAALGVDLPLAALFEAPTVAGMAARAAGSSHAPAVAVLTHDAVDVAPLSFAQRRLWFLDQLQPGSPAYHILQVFRFEGEIEGDIFERALAEIVRRHDGLRTTFRSEAGEPVQVISATGGFDFAQADLRGLRRDERRNELRRLGRETFSLPFDLERGPLLRATLARTSPRGQTLFVCLHHVVSDGWSMEVLDAELRALVSAFAAGRPSPLPELAIQYADYARWERQHLEGEALAAELGWWRRRLAGAPALLNLPTDRPRPAVQSLAGARLERRLRRGVARALAGFSRGHGLTPFMVLLAAFSTLLARWSGQEDIVIGSPIAGRTRLETEPLIGFFVNTLALRTDFGGDPTFLDVLERVRATALEAFDHQELPFERLVEELAPGRDLSRSPLFQAMFVLQNAGPAARRIAPDPGEPLPGDLRRVHWELEGAASKFDLTLTAQELPRGIGLRLEYATDLFERETMERLLDQFEVLLEAGLAAPAAPVWRLPLVSAAEGARLDAFAGSGGGEAPDACLHESFEALARSQAEATAVVDGDLRLTYGELDARAEALAQRLEALGVGPGDRVGVCLPRSAAMVETCIGVLKRGAAYVPIDPDAPMARRELILSDAGAAALVDGEGVRLVGARRNRRPSRRPVTPADLAYILYTSGSTGRPKGVEVEHRQVAGYCRAVAEATGATAPGIRYAMLQPLHVDSSVTVLWGSLLGGGELTLVPAAKALDPAALARLFRRRRIDYLKIAPSHLRALHAGGDPRALMPRRWLVIGGEGSAWSWVRTLPALRRGCRVFNHYGPTETTVGVTVFPVNSNREREFEVTPIGRPLANARAYVLDRAGRQQPIGVAGELYLGGACVARGYCGQQELTAERFVADPLRAGGRLYRTGDLCRWLASGDLEFLGRLDHQVKIRGFRIELGEVEAVLGRHPQVAQALVQAREDRGGERQLVAWVVGTASAAELRRHLRRELPEVMVPSAFVILDRLPLTAHGKVDLQALPAPRFEPAAREHVPPRTEVEQALAGIWSEVLGVESVGAEGHFFELGGHSLLATQVISRLRDRFQVEVPLRALFERPTLAALAGVVDELRN